jgi:hypothetical protein
MNADYKIGGGWGDHIEWLVDDWSSVDFSKDKLEIAGHQRVTPKRGNTLVGEFEKSFIKFKFLDVRPCNDPPDMFFATVKAIEQETK